MEDTTIATVAANGLMTGVKPGITIITITSDANSEATDTIEVEVLHKKLVNNTHTIVRKASENDTTVQQEHIYTLEHKMPINEFMATFDNKEELVHIYGSDGSEIDKSSTAFLGTGMYVTLELDNNTLDRLVVIVKGDISGDGYITAVDITGMVALINQSDNDYARKVAGDTSLDSYVTAVDLTMLVNAIKDPNATIKSLLNL